MSNKGFRDAILKTLGEHNTDMSDRCQDSLSHDHGCPPAGRLWVCASVPSLLFLISWRKSEKELEEGLVMNWFSSVQSLSCVQLFVTPWTAAHQASLPITNSQCSPKPMSTESVMPSSRLILCRPLLFPPSIFLSIRVFSNESALHTRWPKYWSYSFNISPSNEHPGLISF